MTKKSRTNDFTVPVSISQRQPVLARMGPADQAAARVIEPDRLRPAERLIGRRERMAQPRQTVA